MRLPIVVALLWLAPVFARLEQRTGGRLGVYVMGARDGAAAVYRADERFPLLSTLFGASLTRLEKLGASLGYVLVACDLSGSNAFFVRRDLLNDEFEGPFTATALYEPPRYYLVGARGHASRYGKATASVGVERG